MCFLEWRPSKRLFAETSGKNAMVITAAADEDAAIKDLVRSAFGHAGQKCSAASLTIVEASVYDDPRFLQRLADAVVSVRPGSWFHRTECFGPVLGVARADDLDHATESRNASASGLTGGIQSLDDREVDHWLDRVEVGNAYVNRHIRGAIVQRQPFGGWKRSSVGCGPTAGGSHYGRPSAPGSGTPRST